MKKIKQWFELHMPTPEDRAWLLLSVLLVAAFINVVWS